MQLRLANLEHNNSLDSRIRQSLKEYSAVYDMEPDLPDEYEIDDMLGALDEMHLIINGDLEMKDREHLTLDMIKEIEGLLQKVAGFTKEHEKAYLDRSGLAPEILIDEMEWRELGVVREFPEDRAAAICRSIPILPGGVASINRCPQGVESYRSASPAPKRKRKVNAKN